MAASDRTAVRAVVHARLLGIRLLTLDAQVEFGPSPVVPTDDSAFYPIERRDRSRRAPASVRPAPVPTALGNGQSRSLADATRLLAASSEALARTRRTTRTR